MAPLCCFYHANRLMESVKDLIVDVNSTEISIALLENRKLIELNKESSQGHSYSVGMCISER